MKSHELAKALLELPDLLVKVPRMDMINSVETINKVEINTVDEFVAKYVTEEEIKTIVISGPSNSEIWETRYSVQFNKLNQ